MHLLTAKEIKKLEAAGVQVLYGTLVLENGKQVYLHSKLISRKVLLAVRPKYRLLEEFSCDEVVDIVSGMGYIVILDGKVAGRFYTRTGAWYDHGERRSANFCRKRALSRAMKLLGL